MIRYQIFRKGLEVSPEPNTYYPTREQAEQRARELERQWPGLGKLEVRADGRTTD